MEMLLVLGIISLLVGMGVFMMTDVFGDAEDATVKGNIQTLRTNLIRYKTMGTMYPTTSQGLDALVEKPTEAPIPQRWKQFVPEQAIYDPWGNKYQYRYPGKQNPDSYDIFSLGKDGQEGTEDDIGNW